MAWHLSINGKTHGPYDLDQLRDLARQGILSSTSELGEGVDGPWQPASSLPDIWVRPSPREGTAPVASAAETESDQDLAAGEAAAGEADGSEPTTTPAAASPAVDWSTILDGAVPWLLVGCVLATVGLIAFGSGGGEWTGDLLVWTLWAAGIGLLAWDAHRIGVGRLPRSPLPLTRVERWPLSTWLASAVILAPAILPLYAWKRRHLRAFAAATEQPLADRQAVKRAEQAITATQRQARRRRSFWEFGIQGTGLAVGVVALLLGSLGGSAHERQLQHHAETWVDQHRQQLEAMGLTGLDIDAEHVEGDRYVVRLDGGDLRSIEHFQLQGSTFVHVGSEVR